LEKQTLRNLLGILTKIRSLWKVKVLSQTKDIRVNVRNSKIIKLEKTDLNWVRTW
jgi:hypothetical protein